MKAAIIGGGNIGLSLAEGLIHSNVCRPHDITITRRNADALKELSKKNFKTTTDNNKARPRAPREGRDGGHRARSASHYR